MNQSAVRGADEDDPTPTPTVTSDGPVAVPAPPDSTEADANCPTFIGALPITLGDLHSRPAHSDSPYVGAWGEPPVMFRCGVERPGALTATSPLQVVDGVTWLVDTRDDEVVWTVVDRPVYIEVTVPTAYAGAIVSGLVEAVSTLPAQPVDTG